MLDAKHRTARRHRTRRAEDNEKIEQAKKWAFVGLFSPEKLGIRSCGIRKCGDGALFGEGPGEGKPQGAQRARRRCSERTRMWCRKICLRSGDDTCIGSACKKNHAVAADEAPKGFY